MNTFFPLCSLLFYACHFNGGENATFGLQLEIL